MTEDDAKRRFMILNAIRLFGVASAFLGIAIIAKRLIEPADILGPILIAIGIIDVILVPPLLVRSWTRGNRHVARAIRLDGRPVRTPARAELRLPTAALAEAVAGEWRAVGDTVDPRTMPLTGLANAAIDRAPNPEALAAYAQSDLLCYRAEAPDDLVARQTAEWDPLLDWARRRYDVGFAVATGIVYQPQPPETLRRLAAVVAAFDPFVRAGLQPLVTIGGSLVVALAVYEGVVNPDDGFAAAQLDELWQAEKWGEDELALNARAHHQQDFLAAARFLALAAQG